MEKIKTPNFECDIKNIRSYSNLLEIEFETTIDLINIDFSSIDVYTSGEVKCTATPLIDYTTIYKTKENTVILSNDGSVYVEPTPPPIVEPYVPTPEELALQLENVKKNKIAESNRKLEQFLLEHPMQFIDGNHYSVTMEKQNLLTSALALYDIKYKSGMNPVFKWNSTGDTCIIMPIETGMALAIAIGNYVEPIVEQQRIFEKEINLCTIQEQLNNLVIAYETII